MVVFQNKIIYMPSVPPFSRSEKIIDYAAQCKPVIWTDHSLRAADGTAIKVVEGTVDLPKKLKVTEDIVIVYFQGNASSLPPRLPYLSNVLKGLAREDDSKMYTIVALSYRGYWTSKGSPSQTGIELDAEAALEWVRKRYDQGRTKTVVWGQSIGAGVATLRGLILETPFVDLKAVLVALYPQKFLPYRYLAPFLRSTWDSKSSLTSIGESKPNLKVLVLEAGNDEIVPPGQAEALEEVCAQQCLQVDRKTIAGALHTEVMTKAQGRSHVVKFLQSL